MLPLACLPGKGGAAVRGPRIGGPQGAFVLVAHRAVVGFASLVRPQREGRRARNGARRADDSARAAFWCLFVAAPLCPHLQVGGCAVVGAR